MRVRAVLESALPTVADAARFAEEVGCQGAWFTETAHDPFLAALLAAESTSQLHVGTGIAVAFSRSPMHLAYQAHELHTYSGGRFVLGLGSQVRAHVERRFSAPFSKPVSRMRELVAALRAIWASWNDGETLDFRGDFYTHTLMTPFFSPAASPHGPPPVFVAAVGERMTEVAGEVGDGLLVHGFSTDDYLREVTLPALERGLATSGRARGDVEVSRQVLVATGRDGGELAAASERVRRQLAFYASTPAYRPVLERHGRAALQEELAGMVREGRWDDMPRALDDELLEMCAVVGPVDELAGIIRGRFEGLVDQVSFRIPSEGGVERWAQVLEQIQGPAATS